MVASSKADLWGSTESSTDLQPCSSRRVTKFVTTDELCLAKGFDFGIRLKTDEVLVLASSFDKLLRSSLTKFCLLLSNDGLIKVDWPVSLTLKSFGGFGPIIVSFCFSCAVQTLKRADAALEGLIKTLTALLLWPWTTGGLIWITCWSDLSMGVNLIACKSSKAFFSDFPASLQTFVEKGSLLQLDTLKTGFGVDEFVLMPTLTRPVVFKTFKWGTDTRGLFASEETVLEVADERQLRSVCCLVGPTLRSSYEGPSLFMQSVALSTAFDIIIRCSFK